MCKWKIKLLKIKLENFKGIKFFETNFSDNTKIFGDNGTGKTTIFDGFTWLAFNKDSKGVTDFAVKTIGSEESNHSVELTLQVGESEITFKKELVEKNKKQRGTGDISVVNEYNYYKNDVPMKANEFKQEISKIVEESLFRILSDPLHFNNLKVEERRKILFELVGEITDDDILKECPIKDLGSYKVEDFKKIVQAKIKKLKEDSGDFQPRIDEVEKSKVEVSETIEELDNKKVTLETRLKELNDSLNGKSGELKLSIKQKIQEEKQELQNEKNEVQKEINEVERKIKDLISDINNKNNKMKHDYLLEKSENDLKMKRLSNIIGNTEVSMLEKQLSELVAKYNNENAKQFVDSTDEVCPHCKQLMPTGMLEKIREDAVKQFNLSKSSTLEEIKTKGSDLKRKLDELKENIEKAKTELSELQEKFLEEPIYEIPENNVEIKDLNIKLTNLKNKTFCDLKIVELEKELLKLDSQDNSNTKEKIEAKKQELESVLKLINQIDNNKKADLRIQELRDRQLENSSLLLEQEQLLNNVEEFNKAKYKIIEEEVNKKFKYVKFQLFEHQLNGGIKEICEATVDGVQFNNTLNTGAKINAGLDIINTLSELYGYRVPIFIDNAESVTDILKIDTQTIELIVSESDKKLRVEE